MKYQISKVFVTFLDGHELIYYIANDIPTLPRYYLYHDLDEKELKERNIPYVEAFFLALQKFKFIPVQRED